jgi:undecaprenyl-diphosphatase
VVDLPGKAIRDGWQTDVLAGCLIGTGVGCYAHRRDTPWTIQWVPGG